MKNIILLILLLASLQNLDVAQNSYNLEKKSKICFDLTSEMLYFTRFDVQKIGDIRYLTGYQSKSNTIFYTLFDKHAPFKKIKFHIEGPNGIKNVQAVKIINFDSIFVLDKHSFNIYLCNAKSEVLKKWNVKTFKGANNLFGIGASSWDFPMKYDKGKLFLELIPPYYTNEKAFYTSKHLGILDLKSKIITSKIISFSGNYMNGVDFGNYNFYFYLDYSADKIFVSFPVDEEFDIYDKNGLVKSYVIPSKLAPKMDINPGVKNLSNRSWSENDKFEIPRTSYRYIKYDAFRNIIYRIVMLPSDLYDKNNNRVKLFDKPFIVQMISADNYHILSEVKLPENTYDVKNIIAVKEGLLISLCNDNNPDLQEDKLCFQLFSVVKK